LSIEQGNILLFQKNYNYTGFKNLDNWINTHPTTLKVLKSGSLVLGIGLMTSLPYTAPINIKFAVGLALTGAILTLPSLINLFHTKHNTNSHVNNNLKTHVKLEMSKPQNRTTPPISIHDTIMMIDGKIESVHGTGELFCDNEIIEKLNIIKEKKIGPGVYAKYTKHGKAIIQQQATRGCTAAAAAMLMKDNGKLPDIRELRLRNLGSTENQTRDITKAGLKTIVSSTHHLSDLKALLAKNGSAIVDVNGKLGGHVIVVDHISDDLSQIRLRDPYHGWEITVTKEAFLKEWSGGQAIQVVK
jgi:hypothetical protein